MTSQQPLVTVKRCLLAIATVVLSVFGAVGVGFGFSLAQTRPDEVPRATDGSQSIVDQAWPLGPDGRRQPLPPNDQPGLSPEQRKALDDFHRQVAEGRVPVSLGQETGYISGQAFGAPTARDKSEVFPVVDAAGKLVAYWANPWGVIPLQELDRFDFSKLPPGGAIGEDQLPRP
ncbi:MAG: hypothetical protein HYX32_01325 [Actinobacteria bacterium]|nr:hypothetical protein [Actinomycetota bacterium]